MDEKQEQVYHLTDEQVRILDQNANMLRNYQAIIGAQFCEILKNVAQATALEKNIESLQNDIAKELKLPRADRINWNLPEKIVQVVD